MKLSVADTGGAGGCSAIFAGLSGQCPWDGAGEPQAGEIFFSLAVRNDDLGRHGEPRRRNLQRLALMLFCNILHPVPPSPDHPH